MLRNERKGIFIATLDVKEGGMWGSDSNVILTLLSMATRVWISHLNKYGAESCSVVTWKI